MSQFIDGFIEKAKESNNKIDNELYSKFDVKKRITERGWYWGISRFNQDC